MRVLGIDPGSHRTGWGVVDLSRGKFLHVDSGVVHAQGDMSARLLCIAGGVASVLERYEPAAVAVESVFHHKNSQTALKLGQARGVILLEIARHGAALHEYAPAEIKRAATGNGRASKELVERMVRMMLGYRGELLVDASDALAAAICHLQMAGSGLRRLGAVV